MDSKNESPIVIILDIDGTIVGDVTPQTMLYELFTRTNNKDLRIDAKDFNYKLRSGILRPYLGKFLKKLQFSYQGKIEYFIYTAAEKKWTHFLVPHIEKAIGVKFNRPFFTRDNCITRNGEYKKSLDTILPKITRQLSKKYGKLNRTSLKDRVFIIDNSKSVYDEKDQQQLLVCPTYDYKMPENFPAHVNLEIFNKHKTDIINIIGRLFNTVTLSTSIDYVEFQKDFYKLYVPFIAMAKKSNTFYQNDKFFYYLSNFIIYKGIIRFTPKTISYLQKKLDNRANKPQ